MNEHEDPKQTPAADDSQTVSEQVVPPSNETQADSPAASDGDASATESPATQQPTASDEGPLSARGPLASRRVESPGPASAPSPQGRPGSPPPAFDRSRVGVPNGPGESTEPNAGETPATEAKRPGNDRNQNQRDSKKPKNRQIMPAPKPRVAIPSKRGPLSDDLEELLQQELDGAAVEEMLGGQAGMPMREALQDGQQLQGTVIKKSAETVFVSLGGPDEGGVAAEQFEEEPDVGAFVDVVVRGFNSEDGLYTLVLPGKAIDASDWEDLEEGAVIEAFVSATCNGGVEAKVGSIKAFIPISQLSEFRVEDATDFVNKKLMCVVTESNARRKNLVLSHRAILERDREKRREEQLAQISVGDTLEGVVRNVRDFGAFVDLGGVEGLIHVSKLSWDRIQHPSEVLEVGQKVEVKIDKIDEATGKIGLSYRDLLDDPWDGIDTKFPMGSIVKGTVTRIANFGAFVRLDTGIEGLIHISELAHHRVFKVDNVVKEGEEIEVKVLTIDPESQRISLSLKAVQAKPEPESTSAKSEPEDVGPPPEPCIKRTHDGPLKGGTDEDRGGAQFGLKW